MARRGSHWGSFGKGFMDAFLAAYRISMMQDLYANRNRHWLAQEQYWDRIGLAKGAKQQGLDEAIRRGVNDPNFHPSEGGGGGGGGADGGGGGGVGGNAGELRDFYVSQGYTPEGAAAIVGNWQQENSLKGGGWGGDSGTSAGGFQWHDDPSKGLYRGTGFMNWAKENNLDVKDPMTSAKYSVVDLKKNYPDLDQYLRTTKDVDEATQKFEKDFEGAGTPAMGNRLSAARAVYKQTPKTDTTEPTPKVEKASDKTSQADTGKGVQVASMDDSMGLEEFLKQHPEAVGHVTQQNRPNPIAIPQESSGPLAKPLMPPYPQSTSYPQSQGGIPPQPGYLRSTSANPPVGDPGARGSSAVGAPPPPIALGGGRGNELETPTGTPATPIALGGGPGNTLEAPTGVTRAPPALIDPYEATRNIIPARPYTPTPTGGAAEVTRPVVGGDERMQPAAANAPAANAQPVSAVTPQSNQQATPNNPRFVQIEQPNIARTGNARGGQSGDNNAPLMGALNLSWGPNPPLSQREAGSNNIVLASSQGDRAGQTVPAPMPPSRPSDDMVGTPDMASLPDNSFDVTSARKGGPMRPAIPRYAGGGNVTRFAAGGATLGTPATMAQLTSPAYVGPTVSGGWVGTPESQLAPNQQAWAAQQQAQIALIPGTADPSTLNFTMMPDAIWPTAAAPAAPTPLNEPAPSVNAISTPTLTSTTNNAANGGTTTGAYQLPNIVAPTTTPTVNTPTTTVNPTPKIPSTLVPNVPGVGTGASDIGGTNFKQPSDGSINYGGTNLNTGAYAGFRRGGAIPRRAVVGRYAGGGNVTRFATGGAAPTAAQLADPGWQNTPSTYTLPGNAPFTNQQVYNLQNTINSQPYPFLSPLSPSGSKDLTGFYGAYTPPAATPAAPAPLNEPAPSVRAVSTPTLTSTTPNAANGGTTTGAYQLPSIVAPTNNPTVNTPATTFNPTPKTPSTTVPNTPSTGASDFGGTNFKQPAATNTGAYAGFRRGGAIPRRATLTKFAAAGAVTPQQEQTALNNALYASNAPYSQAQVMAGVPGQTIGSMTQADLAAMTPAQQAWYNAQLADLNGYTSAGQVAGSSYGPPTGGFGGQAPTINEGQLTLATNQKNMYQSQFDPNEPAAQAAAAAAAATPAAAPAPAIPPTVRAISTPTLTSTTNNAANGGTTTGAYQLPNIVAPTNNPTITTPTTTINPTPKIPTTTVPNTPNTGASDIGATDTSKKPPSAGGDTSLGTGAYAGFRRGGVTRRVTGYDDGGGVSPAPAGMLPGMGGGQAIPPIYYNPATYAGAGAPVGKGVTNTSAPTYVAGAIPSLPMARGGIVRYDDGGDVQQPDPNIGMDQADQVALNDYDPGDARIEQDIASRSAAENAPASQGTDGMPAFTGYFSPPDENQPPAPAPAQGGGAQSGAQEDPHRPPGLLPYAAQGSDPNGNPSNGFISALTGGIHWLADHLGVVGGAQAGQQALAPDPQTQQNRQVYTSRANMITSANREQLNDMADPHHTLDQFMRNINGLEQGYRWLLAQGDIVGANKMAASVLQYDVANANNYQEEAAKRYYDGDLPGAVKALNAAADAVPADQRFQATLVKDDKGNPIIRIDGSDLTGRQLWQRYAMPSAILGAVNPSMPWTMLENQAAKYDPTFKQMATERAAAAKERYGDQQAAAAAQKFAPPRQVTAPAPAAPAPAMPSVPTPPPTITAGGTGPGNAPTATPASPPPTADSNLAAAGGDTGTALAALPSGPTHGPISVAGAAPDPNAPAPNAATVAQPVDFNQLAAALDHDESVSHQQVALEAEQRYQPQYEAYPDPALVRNKADLTAFNTRREEVAAHNAQVDKAKGEYLTGRQKDVSDRIAAQRARLQAQETDTRGDARMREQEKLQAQGAENVAKRTGEQQQRGWTHEEERPLPSTEGDKIEGVKTISSVPRNAVYKSDGTLDETASAQKAAKAYDLGAPATGGLQRLSLIGDAVRNIRTWNTHIGDNQVGDLVDGLARKIYSIDPNPQTVDHGYGPMYQVNVYRGPRGSTHPTVLLVPQDDFDTISNIRAEFAAASTPTTTTTGTAPPAQAPALPPPPVPLNQTTVRPPVPLITSTPGKPNVPGSVPLRLPERVPVEQMPPEQRQMYPELNQ